MYILTRKGSIDSGAYATVDTDGTSVVQFFVDKDDATTYNNLLSAVGYELQVTETPDESIDKLCDMLGHAYSVVEPGQVVVPRAETLVDTLSSSL